MCKYDLYSLIAMVLMLDGKYEIGAHVWSELSLICSVSGIFLLDRQQSKV